MTEDGQLYKFQRLHVYQLGVNYVDQVYTLANLVPDSEKFNLRSQLERAATSIVLNIAEGSTSQTDAEQRRFLGLALRSYVETVACFDLLQRRHLLNPAEAVSSRQLGHQLFVKLQAMRRALKERRNLGLLHRE